MCVVGELYMLKTHPTVLRYYTYAADKQQMKNNTLLQRESDQMVETRHRHEHLTSTTNKTHVAIGLAFKTPYQEAQPTMSLHFVKELFLFTNFIPSFCDTSSPYYSYHFYITYDFNDGCLSEINCSTWFREEFEKRIAECKTKMQHVDFDMIMWSVNYSGKPAWAQNDALMVAYLEGKCTYYYRVNDDTLFTTKGWTEQMIAALKNMSPKNVGVTGPRHKGGNTAILTYDFVHTSHIDAFGYYYPRIFGAWYNDGWITKVYSEGHIRKLMSVHVKHKVQQTRYTPEYEKKTIFNEVLKNTRNILNVYIKALADLAQLSPQDKVLTNNTIVYCIRNASIDILSGLIRNVHLAQLYLPTWNVRIYFQHEEINEVQSYYSVGDIDPARLRDVYMNHLNNMNAQVYKSETKYDHLQLNRISFEHIFSDPFVSNFALKSPHNRLSKTEAKALIEWSKTGKTPLLCLSEKADTNSGDCVLAVSKQKTSFALRNLVKTQIKPSEDLRVFLSPNDRENHATNVVIKEVKTYFDQYEQTVDK